MTVAVITLALFLSFSPAGACTRIFWNSNGQTMLVARTMDLLQDDAPSFYLFPKGMSKDGGVANPAKWTSRYGSLVTAAFGLSTYCSEGINTQGLAYHYLYLAVTRYEDRDGRRPGVLEGRYGQYLLDNAATVSEALQLMYQSQLVPEAAAGFNWPLHLALEDAQGDSAVVEFVGGQMNVFHGKEFTVLSNDPTLDQQVQNLGRYQYFGGTLPLPGDVDSISRFVRAAAFRSTLDNPSLTRDPVSRLFSAIRPESKPFGAVMFSGGRSIPAPQTLWTSLFDLTHKAVYFTHSMTRNNFWIDMSKLNFSAGAPVLYLKADRPDLSGDVSGMFTPPPWKTDTTIFPLLWD